MPIERKPFAAALAIAMLTFAASLSFAAGPKGAAPGAFDASANPGAALDAMAQQKFGATLSAAERKLVHAAPLRDVPWVGPDDDPDSAAVDA